VIHQCAFSLAAFIGILMIYYDSSSDSARAMVGWLRLVAQFKMLHPVTIYQLIIIIDLELNKVLLHSYLVLCNFEKRDGQ
jgi:hypothetical protein